MYVFDDVDPEPTACMGKAKIPLIALANDKAIKGTFEVRKVIIIIIIIIIIKIGRAHV